MSLSEVKICRIYDCTNEACKAQVAYNETLGDKWRKVCPFCKKHSLLLDRAVSSLSVFTDSTKAKTLGMLGQVNQQRREKEEGIQKKAKPFWRQKDRVNFNVLRNPAQYITTGSV